MTTEKERFEETRAALCGNRLTESVANFLADLAMRVDRLERALEAASSAQPDHSGSAKGGS